MPRQARSTRTPAKNTAKSAFLTFEGSDGPVALRKDDISALVPAPDTMTMISLKNGKSVLVKGDTKTHIETVEKEVE
jgi:hypothetical protein